MTAAIIDFAAIRARRATGQPLIDRSKTSTIHVPVWRIGMWCRTPTNLIGLIRDLKVIGNDLCAEVIAGSGIIQSAKIRDLRPTSDGNGVA